MAKHLTMDELRNMSPADLQREIAGQRAAVAKLRLGIALGKEKGVHLLCSARRQLARMLTVLKELRSRERRVGVSP